MNPQQYSQNSDNQNNPNYNSGQNGQNYPSPMGQNYTTKNVNIPPVEYVPNGQINQYSQNPGIPPAPAGSYIQPQVNSPVNPEFQSTPNRPLPLKITYDRSLGKRGKIIITVCILALSTSFALGFFRQKNIVQDRNKQNDIQYVIRGLNSYYKDSSEFIEKRTYPQANCSGELNSFDYEYTLRKALTGAGLNANGHSYIQNFPLDALGKYTGTFNDYAGMDPKNADKTVDQAGTITCFNALPIFERESFGNKYFDNFQICKFDSKIEPLKFDFFAQKNCYLYTTTENGAEYRLAYYSNALKQFVVYSQYRNGNLSIVYSN